MYFLKSLIFVLLSVIGLTAFAYALDGNDAVVQKMFADYQLDPDFYRIEIMASQLKTEINDSFEVTIEPLSQKEPLGLFTVNVTITQNGFPVEKSQVRMRINKFEEVLVTTDKIKRNEILSEEKLTLKMMDITSLQEQPVHSLDAVSGYRSKRNLSIGHIVTLSAIEPVPDIEVGREVAIIYNSGQFSVKTSGKALQKGWTGDYVKVRNNNSGKILLARVVDESAVVVDP